VHDDTALAGDVAGSPGDGARGYEAVNRGNLEAALAPIHPDIE